VQPVRCPVTICGDIHGQVSSGMAKTLLISGFTPSRLSEGRGIGRPEVPHLCSVPGGSGVLGCVRHPLGPASA
jgi:hypothetical protein